MNAGAAGRQLTARVGYQPAGRDLYGRITRESYHAVLAGGTARTLRIGSVTRYRGEALCGAAPLDDCPPGLFEPVVSCPACRAICQREGITVSMTEYGPRGFPMCGEGGCRTEGIGPWTPWCYEHWTPERDPAGAASWDALGRRTGLPSLSAACDASSPGGADAFTVVEGDASAGCRQDTEVSAS